MISLIDERKFLLIGYDLLKIQKKQYSLKKLKGIIFPFSMEIEKLLIKKRQIQEKILEYIESEEDEKASFQTLSQQLDDFQIQEDSLEFKSFLHLIVAISNNHHRNSDFFTRISQIILKYTDSLKTISNTQIFEIFKTNKRLLLFLLQENLLVIDDHIAKKIESFRSDKYPQYFLPELKPFINRETYDKYSKEIGDNFEENRKIGENENYISQLIRNDSLDEFISLHQKGDVALDSKIKESIFETNSYLLNEKPSLIEYAAFFGSSQILKYIQLNEIKLTKSLMIYAIHSMNYELIHFLEENEIKPDYSSFYKECFKESVLCHHLSLSQYFIDHYSDDSETFFYLESYNFQYLKPNNIKISYYHLEFLEYDYSDIIKLYLEDDKNDVNEKIDHISNSKF